MSRLERQKVNEELKRLGLGGMKDRNLLPSIAFFIRNHEQFRGMLMSVTQDKRHEAYAALAPRLSFPARPLETYEREIKEKAEREKWAVWDGSPYPKEFKVPEIGVKAE